MKKYKSKPYLFPLILLLLTVLCLAAGFGFNKTAKADSPSATALTFTDTHVEKYVIDCNVSSDRVISIKETITVYYNGNAGFFRDIPVNGGEMIKNLSVYELKNGAPCSVYFDVFSESSDFLTVEFDDDRKKFNEIHTYEFTYDYIVFNDKNEGVNSLNFNPLGGGMEKRINSVEITVTVPSSYASGKCYVGFAGTSNTRSFTEERTGDSVVLSLSLENVAPYNAVTFYLEFDEGALTTYFDFTPFYFVIAGGALILLALAFKLLFFNKQTLVPVVNFEAPNKMDPLMMGKLIDNKIDSEDITSMIYYWADKGYLKINLDEPDDPSIIRLVQYLPEGSPDYEVLMFNEMFGRKDVIKPSFLKYSFYKTVDRVTHMVNASAKNLYNSNSVRFSFLFTVLAGALLGLAPLVLALTHISSAYLILAPFISLVPMLFINVLGLGIKYNSLKTKNGIKVGFAAAIVFISAVFVAAYTLFVPTHILGIVPKIILGVVCCALSAVSPIIVCRTKEYTEKLNDIIGFKNFITLAEKDRLEKMLEENPELYYHVLPYAQVLGVSDKWEKKFKDLTVEPPKWATSTTHAFVNFYVFNRIMRSSMASMRSNMVSRPSSSGSSGFGGFGGGGHSGGGHGGGGMRFK